MRIILIIICSLFVLQHSDAQDFITDDQMAETAVAVDNQMKVLYFTASWCGPCKRMKPGIAKISNDPDIDGTIYKMDIDTNITDDIVGVPGVPTFIFLKNGTELGRHTGALSDAALKALFLKHENMRPSNKLLDYQPVPTNLKLVAGAHPKLTRANLQKMWHNNEALAKLSYSIHNNLNDKKDLQAGLVLTQRAIEIKETIDLQMLQSSFHNRLGHSKEALVAAQRARFLVQSDKGDTSQIDTYITQLKG